MEYFLYQHTMLPSQAGSGNVHNLPDGIETKDLCEEGNKVGCRFLVVDAYNKEEILKFYYSNGFLPLRKTEEDERDFYGITSVETLRTRLLYFDLKTK